MQLARPLDYITSDKKRKKKKKKKGHQGRWTPFLSIPKPSGIIQCRCINHVSLSVFLTRQSMTEKAGVCWLENRFYVSSTQEDISWSCCVCWSQADIATVSLTSWFCETLSSFRDAKSICDILVLGNITHMLHGSVFCYKFHRFWRSHRAERHSGCI